MVEKQAIMQSAIEGTNKATARLIQSTRGATVETEALEEAQKASATSAKIQSASLKAVSVAANMLAAWAITAVISSISKLATASEDIREQIKEVSEEFKNTSSEIQDYKARIEELYSTINDSGSSIEDVTTARKDLLVVQDELIDKFGDEESAINNITAAINGQTEALDTLMKGSWQEYKNKFNKSNFWKDTNNWFLGYSDNIDKMLNEYGNYSVDLEPQYKQGKNDMDAFTDEVINELKRRGYDEENIIDTSKKTAPNAPSSDMKILRLKGTANEVHEMLTTIQKMADDVGWDFSDSFDKALENAANNSDELIDTYKEAYDQYVLYEEIFKDKDYVNSFKKLQDAYAEYNEALTSGDKDKIEEATEKYANVLSKALTNADGNEMVIDYFSNMYPDLKKVVDNWKFETKIIPTLYTDSLKGKTKTDILEMLNTEGTQLGEISFNSIVNTAISRGIIDDSAEGIEKLLDLLVQYGVLADDTVKAQDDLQSSALSFKDAWKSLGDTEDSDLKNTQKELLELAEAGQLTEKTFKKTSGAKKWAESMSDPIGDIVDKINSLVTSSDQLSAMSKGISSLSENLYNKTENKDVKIIDADTLAGMSDELKACKKEWKAYEKVMGDANSSTEDAKKATNNLATAYVKSSNFLNNLTKENQNYYISQLENMGVENAREVVTSSLADRQKALELQTAACKAANTDFASSTTDATASLLRENNVVGQTKVALFDLVVQETIFNDTSLNVQDRINKLNSLAKAYFGVSAGIQLANAGVMGTDSRYQKPIDEQYDEFLKKLQEPVDLDINTNGSKSKDKASKSKSKGSDSSKIFDYIEIRLKRLERLHSKYLKKAEDGTKSLAVRNRAYNKVLATTEKQIKAQDKAISRYNKQLKKIGLDDNIAKKIRNGAFDIDTLKGKKKKKAERYQEIYEKRLDAVDERQELKEGINQIKRDKIQTRIDNLENKRSILESASDKLQNDFDLDSTNSDYTKVNSALSKQISNYEKQNKLLQEQQKYVKKGSEEWYKYQDSIDANNQSIQDLTNSMTDNIVNGLDKSLKNLDSADELDEAREENAISASDKNKFADSRLARIFTRRQTYANSLANLGENIKTVATNNGNTAALSKISGYINSGELIPEDMLNGITDSELLYACDQYNAKVLEQQLYEETSKADIRNLIQDKADNIINEAENNLSKIDAKRAKTEAEIKKQEALGVGQSRKDYKEQIKLSRERQEELENEKHRLEEIRAEAIKNGNITEGDDEYNNLTDSINDIESSISDCVVEQIEFNNAIEDMDFSNYESLLKLLKQVSNQFSRYRSLADVHGNAVDDKILFAEIENDNEQIKAGKAEIERQFEEAKDKLMRSLDDGGWGLKLSEEQTDMVLNYVRAGQSGKIPEYLSRILGEDVNQETYPGLFEFLDTIDSATDEIYNAYVDQEEKLDEWIDKRINGVNEYLDALKKEKDIKDRTYAIEKAQYDLEKAKNNLTKKVWDGKQWVYAADTDAVQSAQEAYDNAQYEELINVGEDLIETLEDIKDYINFYDDYGNQILSTDSNTISETLTNQGIPNVDAFLKSKGIDIGAVDMSDFIKNLSSVPLTVNIPQLSTPNFANSYANNPLNIDKIEFVLPNITDNSTAEDLAKGLINQLSNLSSYAKQYDWNK